MEIELKLALHPDHKARIQHHPLLGKTKPQQQNLLSIYFDTPTHDLLQRRIALRIRRTDDRWIQTLKAETRSIGALTSRPEWEVTVARGDFPDFAALPPDALDLLIGIDCEQIASIFTTEFERTTWLIGNQQTQAEVALDHGKIRTQEADRDICEIEIELKSGKPIFLFDLATQLLARAPLHVEPRSKAERGYLLSGAIQATPTRAVYPEIERRQPADEAWHAITQAALVQLTANIPGFLEHAHDIEYLHQLRVALRRLLAGATLAKSLGQPTPKWHQFLRDLMATLNPARDWDVFMQRTLPEILPALNATPGNGVLDDDILDTLRKTAAKTRHQAQAALQTSAFTRFILDIGRSLLAAPRDSQSRNAQDWTKDVLDRRWQKLYRRCHGFSRLNPVERHAARIAAKKLRYVADAFAPLYGQKRTDRFLGNLTALQNELGYANDLIIGQQLLDRLPKRSIAQSFAFGRIHGVLAYKANLQAELSEVTWKRVVKSKLFWH